MPGADFDGKTIISSTEALELSSVPKHLIVIGGGVIGLELGSVWKRLGAEVTVIEMLPALLAGVDDQIARATQRALTKQGLVFHLETRVTRIAKSGKGVTVAAQPAKGEALSFAADHVLVGIGRRPYTAGLGAEDVGVELTESGRIKVNAKYQTAVGSIYAIGDVIDGPMLAHKASEEGIAVAEHLAGKPSHVNYEAIPWIIYTSPEVAWVGRGENQLKQAGVAYRTGSYPFQANPRAKTMGNTEGLVKVIADTRTDRLLGVFVVGPRASDVIAEVALAFEFGASAEDLARAVHAHPTLSEALKEAALGVDKRSIHI
jgi:dihydrolipoamide dehydrogenase